MGRLGMRLAVMFKPSALTVIDHFIRMKTQWRRAHSVENPTCTRRSHTHTYINTHTPTHAHTRLESQTSASVKMVEATVGRGEWAIMVQLFPPCGTVVPGFKTNRVRHVRFAVVFKLTKLSALCFKPPEGVDRSRQTWRQRAYNGVPPFITSPPSSQPWRIFISLLHLLPKKNPTEH